MGGLTCAVVIPVGPGHEALSAGAEASVRRAFRTDAGPFASITVDRVDDTGGVLGRSRARNIGMDRNLADFHFLLDADDRMMPGAFALVDLTAPATFGAIRLDDRPFRHDRSVTPDTLADVGTFGTLCMGFFVRGDLGLRFDEGLDIGEDWDFYMRLPGFTKRPKPLVEIGYSRPSAAGPRGSTPTGWLRAGNAIIEQHRG